MEEKGFINIDKVVSQLDVKSGMTVADFGAGHGFFSVAFAKSAGPSGKIFAIDILPQSLEAVRSRARLDGLFIIKTIESDLERPRGSTLDDGICDLVFIANVLFQVKDKNGLINEARRILKPNGELAVIEWKPYIGLGPQKNLRLSEEELKTLIDANGFGESKTLDAGSHHFGYIFKKI